MMYSDDVFIPGCESWLFSNNSLIFSTDTDLLHAQLIESRQYLNQLLLEDNYLSFVLEQSYKNFDTISRMADYLSNGGTNDVLNRLFDMRTYFSDQAIYGIEDDSSSNRFVAFVKRIWKAICDFLRKIIPWMKKDDVKVEAVVENIETQIDTELSKFSSDDIDNRLKNFSSQRKVISRIAISKFNSISIMLDKITENTSDEELLKLDLSPDQFKFPHSDPVNKYNYSVLRQLVDGVKSVSASMKRVEDLFEKKLSESEQKSAELESGNTSDPNQAASQAKSLKAVITKVLNFIKTIKTEITAIINDIVFIINAAGGTIKTDSNKSDVK